MKYSRLATTLFALGAAFIPHVSAHGAGLLPTSVDNSKTIWFPPVISQKGGSCAQASGIGYMFTYEINRLLSRNASASAANRFSYLFTWNFVNDGDDNGGFVDEGLAIARNFGVMTDEDFGFTSVYQFKWTSGYERYLNACRYRVKRIVNLDSSNDADIEKIKEYLYNHSGDGHDGGGVLTFSTQSVGWTIDGNYSGPSQTGYKSLLTKLATSGAHALTIAGYDDTVESTDQNGKKHLGAFIVVNSWGSWWGDNGRFYLPYYFFTDDDGDPQTYVSSSMTGCDVYENEPKIVFKVRLNYSSRNDLRVTYGASDSPYAGSAASNYNSIIVNNQGGDHPMAGAFYSSTSGILEFAIDFSDHMPQANHQYGRYFINVVRSQRGKKTGEGTIDYLSVFDYRNGTPREYVCRNMAGTKLELGANRFSVPATHPGHFSASPLSHLDDRGNVISGKYFVVRTAGGHYAKLKFTGTRDALTMNYKIMK